MKKVLLAAILGLSLAATAAEEKRVEETQQTTRDAQGNVVDNNSSTTTVNRDEQSKISKGGLFIEPMIMATQEDQTLKTSQLPLVTGDSDGKANGYGLGLRFGGHVSEVVMLGVDARYARVQMKDSFYNDADANIYNIAPTVGLQTPLFGIRILGSYVVAGENNPDAASNGLNLKFKDARGWRAGAGIHVAAVAVTLEYQDLVYDTTEIESFGSLTANNNTNVDMESKGYALSVSFPVEF